MSFAFLGAAKVCCSFGVPIEQKLDLAIHLRSIVTVYLLEFLIYFAVIVAICKKLNSRQKHALDLENVAMDADLGFRPRILYGLLIISRVCWWTAPPSNSEDVWRYLWDGQRVLEGQSVYTPAPAKVQCNSDSLMPKPVCMSIQARIGHADIPTVYPPSAQLIFALSSLISHGVEHYAVNKLSKTQLKIKKTQAIIRIKLLTWRILLLCADLALLAVLISIFRIKKYSIALLLIYALSPTIAFESSLGAHLDLFGMFFMLLSFSLLLRDKYFWAGNMLGIGILIKFIPVIVFLALTLIKCCTFLLPRKSDEIELDHFREPSFYKLGLGFIGLLTSIVMLCLPFISEFSQFDGLWPGLKTYSIHWSFNGSFYPLIESLVTDYFQPQDWQSSRFTIKVSLGALACLIILTYALRIRHSTAFVQIVQVNLFALSVLFLFSPVVFTWYLQWLFPFIVLVINPNKLRNGMKHGESILCILLLLWCFSSNLTYLPRYAILSGKEWKFNVLWTMLEYGILALTLLTIKGYSLCYSHKVSINK